VIVVEDYEGCGIAEAGDAQMIVVEDYYDQINDIYVSIFTSSMRRTGGYIKLLN
jgi:hypothetical protein